MGKDIKELKTFDEQMDFLASDEQEAIDGYEQVIALVEDEHVKAQLEKIKTEEIAHKEFLEKVKEDHSLEYTEPLDQEETTKVEEAKENKKISYGIVYILPDDNDERGEIFDTEEEAKEFAKSIDKEKFNGYRIMKIESHEENGETIYDDEIVVDSEAFDEVDESLT